VPLSHSLLAFNALVRANGLANWALSDADVETMTKEARIPAHLAAEKENDPLRRFGILFRRSAGPVHLTIFDGGHAADRRIQGGYRSARPRSVSKRRITSR
jgi:hypothetical protein